MGVEGDTVAGLALRDASLAGFDVTGANLTQADLTGATLDNDSLGHANLIDVTYDDTTTWPTGFRPPT